MLQFLLIIYFYRIFLKYRKNSSLGISEKVREFLYAKNSDNLGS